MKKRIVRIMTLARVGNLSFVKKVLLVAVSVAVVAVPVLLGVLNAPEVLVQSSAGPLPSFEVASIRPGDPNGEWNFNGGMGNTLEAPNITPMRLILIAYDIDQNQLYALPPWAKSQKFTIRAVGPPEMAQPPGPQRFELMRELVQSLLADRFSLKVHRVTKQLPVFDLVIAKRGPKLKPLSEADFPAVHVKFAPNISMIHGGGSGADVHLTALGAPISLLATELTRRYLGRTVIDKTGLTGRYDFELTWTRSLGELGGPVAGARMSDATEPTPPPDSSGPSIFTAIQEQLGLKLKPTKGPVEVLVIDHIERPSEN